MGKNRFFKILLVVIFLLGVILRFYQLGINPPSLDWDEASIGYNAYSILKTAKDEYGNFLPLNIRSFGDYKPPLYVYLTVPFIALFGLSEFSVRLVAAILGSLTVLIVYFLIKEIFSDIGVSNQNSEQTSYVTKFIQKILKTVNIVEYFALASCFFLAVSPWHLQFSRAAFEGNIGTSFFSLGVLFFLKALKRGRFFIPGGLFFGLSMYSYHSFRVITPLFLFALVILFYKSLIVQKKIVIVTAVLFLIFSLPVFKSFFAQSGSSSRLSMVTVFSGHDLLEKSIERIEYDQGKGDFIGPIFHNRRLVYFRELAKNYLDHFDPGFLFIYGDGGRQHHAVDMGMLYLWELPFILLGIFVLSNLLNKKTVLLFIWFLIAPLPAAVTTGTPHPVRAIAMLPEIHIFTAIGVVSALLAVVKLKSKILKVIVLLSVLVSFLLNFSYYLHQYYVHTPIEYGDFWQYGYKDLFNYLAQVENQYDKIIVTYKYDQPYIYYLFYNRIKPSWYQQNWDKGENGIFGRMDRKIGKYEFRNINWVEDSKLQNSLIIGTPQEIPKNAQIIKEILFPNGETTFKIAKNGS